jgi:hypothetical protein
LVFTWFVVARALDRVFLNRVLKIMGPYRGALMNLYWPFFVQCMTAAISIGYVCKMRFVDKDKRYGLSWFLPWSPLASSQGRVPFYWMALFSLYDQLNAAITVIPQIWLPEAMQTALTNTVVFWTALIAYFYLGSRFKQVHYAGCLLVMVAVVVGMAVELQQGGLPSPTNADGRIIEVSAGVMCLMYVIYLIGVLPLGVSNCYKQKIMKGADLDCMWASWWSGNMQIVWGLLCYTMNWIPYPVPGGHNTQSPATLGSDLADAWTCFGGTSPKPTDTSCSTGDAWVWFIMYLAFNVFFNLLMLWLTKYLSATWASIGNILCGDLYGVFGQFKIVSGSGSKWMPLEQWLSLILSSIAMWVYNIEDEMDIDGKSVYGVPKEKEQLKDVESSDLSQERQGYEGPPGSVRV